MDAETLWRVPRRLDEPLRILMLTPVEFSLAGVGFFAGIVTDTLLVWIVVFAGGVYGLRMMRVRYGVAWFTQACFWYLPLRFRGVPSGYQRLWRG